MATQARKPINQHDIPLGASVRDRITGVQGIAIAKVEYLFGCTQFGVQPASTDGKRPDQEYLDWQRLEVIDEGEHLRDINTSEATLQANGCDTAPVSRRDSPRR